MKFVESFFCWFIAFSLSWSNLTNGWMWITYASISDFTAQYYQVSLNQVNWISLLYSIIIIVGMIPFIWLIDYFGLKLNLILSAILNLACAVIHFLSSYIVLDHYYRYIILIIGSIIGGLAQPLCLFSSTKLAVTWFSPENRISANTLASMGNPIGVLLSNLLSPIIVTSANHIPFLNTINLIPSSVGLILVLLSVYFVPKELNKLLNQEKISFIDQIKCCIRNLHFWILVLSYGILLATFITISTLIQQILCPFGYTDLFSGICGALFLVMGIPGVLIIGPIVTRTKSLQEIVKFGILLTTIGIIGFSITSILPKQHLLIAISVSLMGIFGFGIYPSTLELAAETAYPAGEVLSTGLLFSFSQFLSLIFIVVAQVMAVAAPNFKGISVCSVNEVRSYWIPIMVLAILNVVNAIVFFFSFTTDYKRTIWEIKLEAETNESYVALVDEKN